MGEKSPKVMYMKEQNLKQTLEQLLGEKLSEEEFLLLEKFHTEHPGVYPTVTGLEVLKLMSNDMDNVLRENEALKSKNELLMSKIRMLEGRARNLQSRLDSVAALIEKYKGGGEL